MKSRLSRMWQSLERCCADRKFVISALAIIFFVGLGLRAALAWLHPMLLPDSIDYLALAHRILHGQSYRVTGMYAKRMPGYPVFLAAVGLAGGLNIHLVLLIQAVFGALVSLVVFAISRPIGTAAGLLAALLTAVDPLCVGFSAAVLTEIPFMLLFVLALWLLIQLLSQPGSAWRWILFSICFATGVYVRAEVALCIFPLLGWLIWMNRRSPHLRHAVGGTIASLAILTLILLPWWLRNYRLFHHDFFRFTTLQGISLYESVYSGATGGPRQSDIVRPPAIQNLPEGQRDAAWTRRAFADVFDHPFRMVRLGFVKIGRTWSPWLHARGYSRPWLNALLCVWYVPLFLLALAGLPILRTWRGPAGILLIGILYFTAMHAVFLGSVRYRVPVMPLVCIFAAAAPAIWLGHKASNFPVQNHPTTP